MARALALAALAAGATQALSAQVAEVQVTPAEFALEAGKTQALYAAAYDRQGNLVTSAGFAFQTSDSSVATVSPEGVVTAVGNGTARIEAVSDTLKAAATVRVTGGAPPVAVASFRVEPRDVRLLPLEPVRLVARALDAAGNPVRARITWSSLSRSIATVDRDGMLTGVAPGHTLVEAAVAGAANRDTVLVIVEAASFVVPEFMALAPGGSDTIIATIPAQGGRRLMAGLGWRSSDTSVVRTGAAGVVTGVAPGQADVVVSGYGTTARTRVRVHRAVQSLTIIPGTSGGPVRIPMAQSRRFEVRALAADSTPVPEARVTWSVADTSIATFDDSTGMLAAVAAGTTTLSARIAGFEPVSWTIEVVPARVALDRSRLAVGVGGRDSLRAELVDERGEPIDATIPQLTWTSSSPAITLSPDGGITGRSLGSAAVVATAPWGAAASATVYVTGDLLISSNRGATTPQGFGIFQRAAGSNEFTPIRSDSATSLQAVFSPDRTRIAFSSNAAGSFDLYVMDADGANAVQVTSDSGQESEPAWSRDGERIYFARSASGGSQIASVAIDGSGLQLLTSVPGGHLSPVVSPDGRTIAFVTARDGNYEVYQMAADGSNARRLTDSREREQLPRFLPNGDLIFLRDRSGGGSDIIRLGQDGASTVAESDDPVLGLAVARDGNEITWVTGRMLDRSGTRIEYRLVTQKLTVGAAPVVIRFEPGEQVATPSY